MRTEQFNSIVEARIEKIKDILQKKGEEYKDEETDDRLYNFRAIAEVDNVSMEQALWGAFLKQYVGVRKMVKKPETITEYLLQEKLGDVINYMILLECVMRERLDNRKIALNKF